MGTLVQTASQPGGQAVLDAGPAPHSMRHTMWKRALEELVATGGYGTQSDLVDSLRRRGFDVTQSSVSRELKARGVKKVNGIYSPGSAPGLPDGVELLSARTAAGGPLVVLQTQPACAPLLAAAVDGAELPGVLGTVAGDDTVFVACTSFAAIPELEEFLGRGLQAV